MRSSTRRRHGLTLLVLVGTSLAARSDAKPVGDEFDANGTLVGRSSPTTVEKVTAPGLWGSSDEFEDAGDLQGWTLLDAGKVSWIDVNASAAGKMTMVPSPWARNAWYEDDSGGFVFKSITGDFVVEVEVNAGGFTDPSRPLRGEFGGAGVMVRDPASGAPRGQRLVSYELGYHANSIARTVKTTRPAVGGSLSTVFSNDAPDGGAVGRLRICRLGSVFRFFHRQGAEGPWVEEKLTAATGRAGNGAAETTPGIASEASGTPIQLARTDLPATVQVGMAAGNWLAPLQTRAEFGYVRFAPVSTVADCTAPIDAPM